MTSRSLRLSLAVLVLVLASSSTVRSAELERFAGSYAFAGGSDERARHEEAVGTIARKTELLAGRAGDAALPKLEVTGSGEHLSIATEQGEVEGPADGRTFGVARAAGGEIRVTRTLGAGGTELVETRELPVPRRGRSRVSSVVRTDTYRLAADGQTLTRSSRIEGGSLRKAVEYEVTFKRSVQTARSE